MKTSGLRLMVCPAMEEDEGEGGGEEKYDYNMEYIANIGDMMVRAGADRPCLQFKITAFAPADLGWLKINSVRKKFTSFIIEAIFLNTIKDK